MGDCAALFGKQFFHLIYFPRDVDKQGDIKSVKTCFLFFLKGLKKIAAKSRENCTQTIRWIIGLRKKECEKCLN